jgi:hypothetical protein
MVTPCPYLPGRPQTGPQQPSRNATTSTAVAPPPLQGSLGAMRRPAGPPRPIWGHGPRFVPNGRRRPRAPAPHPAINDRADAPKHTRPRDPSRRERPPPTDPHRRREEDASKSPPSAWGKAVRRRRRHQGFAQRLLLAAATGGRRREGGSGRG